MALGCHETVGERCKAAHYYIYIFCVTSTVRVCKWTFKLPTAALPSNPRWTPIKWTCCNVLVDLWYLSITREKRFGFMSLYTTKNTFTDFPNNQWGVAWLWRFYFLENLSDNQSLACCYDTTTYLLWRIYLPAFTPFTKNAANPRKRRHTISNRSEPVYKFPVILCTRSCFSDEPVPWLGHLVRTSGALKPGVPALGASCCLLHQTHATTKQESRVTQWFPQVEAPSRGWFTWTCRHCKLGQSDNSCRWGLAERPAVVCGCCCSECGQKVLPCSPQTASDSSRPQFCWVLSAKEFWKMTLLKHLSLAREDYACEKLVHLCPGGSLSRVGRRWTAAVQVPLSKHRTVHFAQDCQFLAEAKSRQVKITNNES